jgi:metallo-beta-lactamase family protein
MLNWLKKLESPPKQIFLVHGEPESAKAFSEFLRAKTGWQVSVPAYEDQVVLE